MLSLGPSPRLLHRSPDVGSFFGRVGIAREIFIVKGTFNLVMSHAVCIGGDTEGDVCGGGSITVFAGSPEAFEGHI